MCKIDTQYEAKKRKFLEDSDKFRRELKRVSFCLVGWFMLWASSQFAVVDDAL